MFPGETVLSQGEAGLKDPHNGPFKVMQSHGSLLWYIGTMFLSCGVKGCKSCGDYNYGHSVRESGSELAYGSRETDYFNTKKEADEALEIYKKTGELPNQRY